MQFDDSPPVGEQLPPSLIKSLAITNDGDIEKVQECATVGPGDARVGVPGGLELEEEGAELGFKCEENHHVKKKAQTAAERKRLSRAAQSSTKKETEKEKDRERKKLKRSEQIKLTKIPKTPAERKRTSREDEKRKRKQDMGVDSAEKIGKRTCRSISTKMKSEERESISAFERNNARMKKNRASLSDEEKAKERFKARIGMAKSREIKSEQEKKIDKSKARIGMVKSWDAKTEEEKLFINIKKKQRIREQRKGQTEEDHFIQNAKAQKGMKLLKEEGRLRSFKERTPKISRTTYDTRLEKDENEWAWYVRQGEEHRNLLKKKRPDIVSKLNEKWRKSREKATEDFEKEQEAIGKEAEKTNESMF